ncbi:hypothetical protein CVS47_00325 [Microbacterium lemovicicum]|uniref:Uncharacterized protein n=1 Tax=Microbacterium lemovicicum TaxID=1072463 RepID=A0A3Q9J0F7_9MICO|nr:hypothetical protein CVS47_00325 [Microbacterium lemovicicum]
MVRQTEAVIVDVTTLTGEKMTEAAAQTPLGSSLRIAAGFVATSVDDASGIETTIEAHYRKVKGRYVPSVILNRGVSDNFDEEKLRHTSTQGVLQAAVPHCIAVRLDEEPEAKWATVSDLTADDNRILAPWLVAAVVKHGVKDERWDVIEILYGVAALAGRPPVKLITAELAVPERTASDWIKKARKAGRLTGMTSAIGRPAHG